MTRKLVLFFGLLALIVLLGKFSNWFLHYSDATNRLLDTLMFCIIGLGCLGFTFAFSNKIIKAALAICGLYLMTMYFIPEFYGKKIIGICCILTMLFAGRFLLKDDDKK